MKNFKFLTMTLLSVLLSNVFLMESKAANAHVPFLAQLIDGTVTPLSDAQIAVKVEASYPYLLNDNGQRTSFFEPAQSGSVMVLPVKGVVMKEDYCGDAGMETMAKWVISASKNKNITGLITDLDSPGGQASGTEYLGKAIKNFSKPTVAFVNGMAASAGYWIGSQHGNIIMSGKSDFVGSIGTMTTVADWSKRLEGFGIKLHDIYSSLSPDKNGEYYQALEGNYEPMQKNILDPLTRIFHDAVNSGRNKLDASTLTGKIYYAEEAIKLGLADRIGTFDDAMKVIAEANNTVKINFN